MILTEHSKQRMRERTNLNHKERMKLFREALTKGKSPKEIKNKEIKQYLAGKQYKCQVKLYKGYVFVHSKTSKKIYTMYKLPEIFDEKE